jgi:hypothetical protein
MQVVVLYRPNSDHQRKVEEFTHDFSRLHPDAGINLVSLDTVEGAQKARVYGIIQYPAVLAMTNDGQLLKNWEGEQLPLMNEVAYYATQ